MSLTWVDAAVAAIILISGMLAYSRGVTREVFAIAGWLIAAFAGFYLAPFVLPLIREIPVVGPFLDSSCVLGMIAAFIVVVAAALLILSIFTPLFATMIQESALGPVDRAFGFIFGVVRGIVLIAIAFLLFTNLAGDEVWPPLQNAASRAVFVDAAALIEAHRPEELPPWLAHRIDALMAPCNSGLSTPGQGQFQQGQGT